MSLPTDTREAERARIWQDNNDSWRIYRAINYTDEVDGWSRTRPTTTDDVRANQPQREFEENLLYDRRLRANRLVRSYRARTSRPNGLHAEWRYKRRLGTGGRSLVTLWQKRIEHSDDEGDYSDDEEQEYLAEQARRRRGRVDDCSVAVKVPLKRNPVNAFMWEKICIKNVFESGQRQLNHIVKCRMITVAALRNDNLTLSEWCQNGNLARLIQKRRLRGRPFFERTLWEFLRCLLKGLAVLDHGSEDLQGSYRSARGVPDQGPLTHGDLKPSNVMLADYRIHDHPNDEPPNQNYVPTLKIGDFGLGAYDEEFNVTASVSSRANRRNEGTPGHHPPETFSEEWDDIDFSQPWDPDIVNVGRWGTWTNIWQVGVIMYQLMRLSGPPGLEIHIPSSADIPDHRIPFRGVTYGVDLNYENGNPDIRFGNYSKSLRWVVWSCLKKEVNARVTLAELNEELDRCCQAISEIQLPEVFILDDDTFQEPGGYEWDGAFTPDGVDEVNGDPVYGVGEEDRSNISSISRDNIETAPSMTPMDDQGPSPEFWGVAQGAPQLPVPSPYWQSSAPRPRFSNSWQPSPIQEPPISTFFPAAPRPARMLDSTQWSPATQLITRPQVLPQMSRPSLPPPWFQPAPIDPLPTQSTPRSIFSWMQQPGDRSATPQPANEQLATQQPVTAPPSATQPAESAIRPSTLAPLPPIQPAIPHTLLLKLYHYFSSIPSDIPLRPSPSNNPNAIRVRNIRIPNTATLLDLKQLIATPWAGLNTNAQRNTGLGLVLKTIRLKRMDCRVPVVIGEELNGWELRECGLGWLTMLYVEGEIATSSEVME